MPTHQYAVTLERTIAQRTVITVKADDLDEAIRLALDAARKRPPDLAWRHHATAATPSAPRDLVADLGEPAPVLPFRGPVS